MSGWCEKHGKEFDRNQGCLRCRKEAAQETSDIEGEKAIRAQKIRLTKTELAKLPEYSVTLPTGTQIGKWWRRYRGRRVSVGTFVPSDISGRIGIHWYDVKLVKEDGYEMKVSYDQERLDYANTRLDAVEEERDEARSRVAALEVALQVGSEWHVQFWETVNAFADAGRAVYGNTRRMDAVTRIEDLLRTLLTEEES